MIMRLALAAGTACLILCATTAPAQAQTRPLPISVSLGGRMQFQWNSTSVDADEAGEPIASSTFETRRVRLSADVRVGDWIRGFIEPDFALGRLQLKQVWMSFELDPALAVRAGQFKKPFSVINLTSSTAHPMIERGVRIRGLAESLEAQSQGELSSVHGDLLIGEQHALLETQGYLAYDMGVALEGELGAFGWQAGVFNGNGPDSRDENGGKSLAARATYELDVGTPVTVGGAWSRRELSWPAPGSRSTAPARYIPVTEAVAEEFGTETGGSCARDGRLLGHGRRVQAASATARRRSAMRRGTSRDNERELCEQNGVEYVEMQVAIDGLAVVANAQNEFVECLTVDELRRMWEPGSQVNNWSQVREGFPDEPVKLYGPGTNSGTFDYFTEAIMGEERAIRPDFTASEDDNVLVQGVEGDRNALGYFGYAYFHENRDRLKAVGVDNGQGCVSRRGDRGLGRVRAAVAAAVHLREPRRAGATGGRAVRALLHGARARADVRDRLRAGAGRGIPEQPQPDRAGWRQLTRRRALRAARPWTSAWHGGTGMSASSAQCSSCAAPCRS
jgi:hypothetical protein